MQNRQQIPHDINDDLKFLIACCQINTSEKDIKFILECISGNDDEHLRDLISLSVRHGILPLVYKAIKKLSESHSSLFTLHSSLEHLLADLKSAYSQIAHQNMLMSAELIRIMKLLKENDIEALVFKGPALSQMAYGDITLRQYVDIDILVDENDVYKAGKLIASNNYISDVDLAFLKNEALLNVSSDLGFRHATNNTYIELHWKLFRKKLSITLDGLNLRSNPTIIKIHGREIKTLQSDLLLVYLCAHGSKHMWERIEWIVDIDRLIRNLDTIDWDKVWEYAETMHSVNTLLLGLSLSRKLFHTEIPAMMEDKINQNTHIEKLEAYTLHLLNQNITEQKTETSAMFKKFEYHANLYDSFGDKVKYYLSTVFKITPDDVLNVNLPRHLSFLYFIIRPFRIAKKYIRK